MQERFRRGDRLLHRLEGIVLRSISYGEAHKIVTILTKEAGKLAVMARGAKKPASRLASITQPFTHGLFLVYTGKGMGTLQQGERIDSMRYLQTNLEAAAYASLIVELVDRLTEQREANRAIFDLVQNALQAIQEEYDPEAISFFVEWKMLPIAGIHPTLHGCASCGSTEGEFAFSFQEIGFLCHRCFSLDPYLIRLSPIQVRLIRTFYQVPIHQIGSLQLKKPTKQFMRKMIRTIYDEQVGIRLNARTFIDQIEQTPILGVNKKNSEEMP